MSDRFDVERFFTLWRNARNDREGWGLHRRAVARSNEDFGELRMEPYDDGKTADLFLGDQFLGKVACTGDALDALTALLREHRFALPILSGIVEKEQNKTSRERLAWHAYAHQRKEELTQDHSKMSKRSLLAIIAKELRGSVEETPTVSQVDHFLFPRKRARK